MAPRALETPDPALRKRVASGVLLVSFVLVDVILGGWFFAAFVLLTVLLMAHEWAELSTPGTPEAGHLVAAVAALVPAVAIIAVMLDRADVAALALGVGCVGAAGLAALVPGASINYAAGGVAYIGLPALALVWLRAHDGGGAGEVMWLLSVVWATDIMAYYVGRRIGGPKLAPRVSPGKTWAGLVGGMAGAAATGGIGAAVAGGPAGAAAALGGFLAVVAQIGDLFESYMKRRAGVKDSGALIPGHGGVLDRLDGLLFAAPAYVLIAMLSHLQVV
jgi:phosphatidate cytidylyltransferase